MMKNTFSGEIDRFGTFFIADSPSGNRRKSQGFQPQAEDCKQPTARGESHIARDQGAAPRGARTDKAAGATQRAGPSVSSSRRAAPPGRWGQFSRPARAVPGQIAH